MSEPHQKGTPIMAHRGGWVAGLAALLMLSAAARGQVTDAKLREALDQTAKFRVGDPQGPLTMVAGYVAAASGKPAEAKALADELATMLGKDATVDAKRFICRQLWLIGDASHVPAAAKLLEDAELSHMARYALERMPTPAAGDALREALGRVKGRQLAGVINSLGERRDAKAAGELIRLTGSDDRDVSLAAIRALGKIGHAGGKPVIDALAQLQGKGDATMRTAAVEAYLDGAQSCVAAGDAATARGIYEQLFRADQLRHVRLAALGGLVATATDEQAVKMLTGLLIGQDSDMAAAAARRLESLPGDGVTTAIMNALRTTEAAATRAMMLDALAARGDRTAATSAIEMLSDRYDTTVRLAAVRTLGTIGDGAAVEPLARAAAAGDGPVRDEARQALRRLRGDDVERAMLAAIKRTDAPARIELIKALTDRRAEGAVDALLAAATDRAVETPVRVEAYKAVAELGGQEVLGRLVTAMAGETDGSAQSAAERAAGLIAERIGDAEKAAGPIVAAHGQATGASRAAMLRVLGRIGGASALAAVRGDLSHTDAAVADAAHRAIFGWPTADAAEDALRIAQQTKDDTHYALALRGYVRMTGLSSATAEQRVKMYQQAMAAARRDEEKKLVLSGLSTVADASALKAAQAYLNEPGLAAEAKAAHEKITAALTGPPTPTASHGANDAGKALDGDAATRWTTGTPMRPGMWFQLDMKSQRTIARITLDSRQSGGDYPRGWEVYVFNDPSHLGKPLAKGQSEGAVTVIALPAPATGRYVRIVQTGSVDGLFWSIHELKVE